MAAGGGVGFGCVAAAAGAPGASDLDLYRGMLADCDLAREVAPHVSPRFSAEPVTSGRTR